MTIKQTKLVHTLQSIEDMIPNITIDFKWPCPHSPKKIHVSNSKSTHSLLKRLPDQGLAIVGTRNPRPKSMQFVRNLITHLRHSNLILISGLATGIDTCVHQSALDFGLPTIAVLAGGFDQIYPKQNIPLAKEIVNRGGMLMTEYSLGITPKRHFFLYRNRLIAALSKTTCVIEAAQKSGALNTARWAREMQKDIYATPAHPTEKVFAGNQKLITDFQAIPLYDVHQLGSTWLELVSIDIKKNSNLLDNESFVINTIESQGGQTEMKTLFDTWINHKQSIDEFFCLIESMQKKRYIIVDDEKIRTLIASHV